MKAVHEWGQMVVEKPLQLKAEHSFERCSHLTTALRRASLGRVLGKIFVMVLSCHSNDVDVFSLLLDCAFGGFPLHLPIRL